MRIVIINNETKYLESLEKLFSNQEVVIFHFDNVNIDQLNIDDLVILSGGHGHPVLWHGDEYAKEIEIVKKHKGPILGICLGFQLIVHVFGSHFHLLDERRKGILRLYPTKEAGDLFSRRHYEVYENHNWCARAVGTPLIPLMKSEDGIEIIRHENRPIYAVQFHPEAQDDLDGKSILLTIMRQLGINNIMTGEAPQ